MGKIYRIYDGSGDSGLALRRPGFRVTDAPITDALQRAYEDYERDLTTAWRRGGKEVAEPDAPRAVDNNAEPVLDIETAYRLYAEEISGARKAS